MAPSVLLASLWLLPFASGQLHQLAKKAGKMYFGTATDTGELVNKTYYDILTDTKEFGQVTPSNGQKVPTPLPFPSRPSLDINYWLY
jgi:endo-1,4-beta-xylanase